MTESNSYAVRLARLEDVEVLARMRLNQQAHLEAGTSGLAPLSPERIATMPDYYRECLAEDRRWIVVVTLADSDVPVGMAMGRIEDMPSLVPSRYGWLDDVWVDPAHRCRGLCKRMVRAMLEFFREHKVDRAILNYMPGNVEATATWTRLGFVPFRISAQTPLQSLWDLVEEKEQAR